MKTLLFIDRVANRPQTPETMRRIGSGASDSYVVFVARAIATALLGECRVVIAYPTLAREEPDDSGLLSFVPLASISRHTAVDAIVIQRDPELVLQTRDWWDGAPRVLWLSDFADKSRLRLVSDAEIQAIDVPMVTLSDWHRHNIEAHLCARGATAPVHRIFYPVEAASGRAGPIDRSKLVFLSAPHKGLELTLRTFLALRSVDPDFMMYVGNPGYVALSLADAQAHGVVDLGVLPREEVFQHLRSALCAVHLNREYPETFGAINAEANAVGTPVLTYDLGAASEVLAPAELQTLPLDASPSVAIDRILAWKGGDRPMVFSRPEFSPQTIARQWTRLLGLSQDGR